MDQHPLAAERTGREQAERRAEALRTAAEAVLDCFGWHAGEVVLEHGKDGPGALRALHAALTAVPAQPSQQMAPAPAGQG